MYGLEKIEFEEEPKPKSPEIVEELVIENSDPFAFDDMHIYSEHDIQEEQQNPDMAFKRMPKRNVTMPVSSILVHAPGGYIPQKEKKGGLKGFISSIKSSFVGGLTEAQLDEIMKVEEDPFDKSNSDVILAKPGTII
jgi:hypothetical protein